jgi:lactoylglutathione lyase
MPSAEAEKGLGSKEHDMIPKLSYVIEFVDDMDRAVKFFRDVVGLTLKFQSPGWSEFSTGDTVLALHPASTTNPAGKVEFGFSVHDLQKFYDEAKARGVKFPMPPKKQDFGGMLAQLEDSEGGHVSVAESGPA